MYIELKNINKKFGDFKASDNVSFGIEKGSLIGLLGPSGSGKTTILRMIAGLENPDSGEIIIDGKVVNNIHSSQRGIGFVFQSYALFRYMTVYDNIAFGLKVQKADKNYIRERVTELIELIGLKGLEKRYPSQLSGGQRQRVAFARALAPNPQLLLLDEPFAAIDAKVRQELRSWLRETITKLGITSIFVTHDQDEAIEVADKIIITNKGRIEQIGTPLEVYQNPQTAFTASFFGHTSFLEDYTKFSSFDEIPNAEKAIVRPEFVKVAKKDENIIYPASASEGEVTQVAFRGNTTELTIKVNGSTITANRGLNHAEVKVGEKVNVFLYRIFVTSGSEAYADEVDLSNLQRQIIHATSDIGKAKVQSAKETMEAINPDVTVKTYRIFVTSENISELIADYDFIIDGTDNFPAKFLINDACVMAKKPFSHAGIIRFKGQLMTYVPGQGPCYRCVFKNPPPKDAVPTCKQAGVIGAMGGVIGSLQAMEAVKYIIGKGELLTGYLLTYDALTMEFRKVKLPTDTSKCAVCGDNPTITELIDYEQAECDGVHLTNEE